MSIQSLYELIISNEITNTLFTVLIIIFTLAMLSVPFIIIRIHSRLGQVIKLQEEAKKRALKDRELRTLPRDLS